MARDPYRRSPLTAVATGLRRLAALAVVLGMTIGVPAGLVTFFGNPLPDTLPSGADGWQSLLTAGFTDETVIGLVVVCLWAVWALWVYSLLIETISLLSGRAPRTRSSFSPMRGMAAALIAGILATPAAAMAATAPAPAAAAVAIATPQSQAATSSVVWTMPGTAAQPETEVSATVAAPAEAQVRADLPRFAVAANSGVLTVDIAGQQHTIEVKAGDTLWSIAERCLGDGNRYGEIYDLNKDSYDASGRMLGGEHIEAGWVLTLPADAVTPGASTPPAPPVQAQTPPPPVAETPAPPPVTVPPSVAPSYPQGGDGVAPQPSTSASVAPSTSASASAEAPAADKHDDGKPGVSLTGSSWMDLGLGGAVLAAAAAVWAHRRRRYRPRPPVPGARDNDPDLRPLPKVVGKVRRGMPTGPRLLALAAVASPTPVEPDEREAVPAQVDGPVTPALDSEWTAAWSPAGLGLTGPGAHDAARGLLAATLANGDVSDPHRHSRVLIPATTLATLLGTSALDVVDTPRLTVTPDLDTALEALETTALHRSRMVYDHEADDVAGVRAADPLEEPMPPVVLIADASAPHAAARVAALLTQGRRLDLHGILLGDWPAGHTVTVAEDGTTARPDGLPAVGEHPADLGRLTVLDADETCDLLRVFAEATTGLPQPEPAVAEGGHDEEKADLYVPQAPEDDTDEPADEELPASSTAGEPRVGRPARVRVLGAFDVEPSVDPVPDGDNLRGKSKELLIYLAANNGRASKDTLIENLLPEAKIVTAHHRLNTLSSNLRGYLRRVNGPGLYLERTAHHYQLRDAELDLDLLRMRAAMAAYAQATDDDTRIAALREAVGHYGGPLADGLDIDWIDIDRTKVARQALDAHVALAELLTPTAPEDAVALLDAAIDIDPTIEDTYRRAMLLRASLGDADGVRALRRAVTAALSDIDADPEEETLQLAGQLLAGLPPRTTSP